MNQTESTADMNLATSEQALTDEPIFDFEARQELDRLRMAFGVIDHASPRMIDGRYEVIEVIDRGGMGVVYLAYDTSLDRKVALKVVVSAPFVSRAQLEQRAKREANLLASVEHANVVPIYDVGAHRGEIYMTMRYIHGMTLRSWQQGKHPLRARVAMYLQAARGLAAAHQVGIVHRDFKPDNVLVDAEGVTYVGDFGVALMTAATSETEPLEPSTRDDEPTHSSDNGRMTRTGQLLGTRPYMAPEQLLESNVSALSDQFGFCAALWEACTGEVPFPQPNPREQSAAIERGPRDERGQLPKWLREPLERGLAADPQRRYADVPALVAALEKGLGRRRRFSLWVGGLAIAGLAIVPWLSSHEPALQSCEDFRAEVDAVWTSERKAALLSRTELDAETLAYVTQTMDTLARGWEQDAARLCDGEDAPLITEPRRVCMEGWLASADRQLQFFITSEDPAALDRAFDLTMDLTPLGADYCGPGSSPPVLSEVWERAELARAHAMLGDFETARALAEQALTRAQAKEQFSPSTAEALFAQAEVEARAREAAGSLFFAAQAHALASGHDGLQLELLLLWTKTTALRFDETSAEEATRYLQLIEPFLWRARVPEGDVRRTEYLEAEAMVERALAWASDDEQIAREHWQIAIEQHRRAAAEFMQMGRAELAAKALHNAGANFQDLDEPEQAATMYADAIALLTQAGVPPRYPTLVGSRLNRGNLLASLSPAGEYSAEAVEELEQVVRHGSDQRRLAALSLLCQHIANARRFTAGLDYAERALLEIERPTAAAPPRLGVFAGFVLAGAGDPRGWAILTEALDSQDHELSEDDWRELTLAHVELLEEHGRCVEAASQAQALRAWAGEGREFDIEALLDERRNHLCASDRANSPSNKHEE